MPDTRSSDGGKHTTVGVNPLVQTLLPLQVHSDLVASDMLGCIKARPEHLAIAFRETERLR